MTGDTTALIVLGLGGLLVLWLVFSVFKKVIGVAILVALAAGAWILWNNPAMLQDLLRTLNL